MLQYFRHGAERFLLASFGNIRYPLSGKAASALPAHCLCRGGMITILNFFVRIRKTYAHKFCPEGRFPNPIGIHHLDVRRDLNPQNASLTGLCNDVISAYTLESPHAPRRKTFAPNILQVYFTIFFSVFHGKKAANSHLSPQFFCFFNFSTIKFRKDSGSVTSAIGPKERIRIAISDSSWQSYRIFTR